jgi:hypothetical protein
MLSSVAQRLMVCEETKSEDSTAKSAKATTLI